MSYLFNDKVGFKDNAVDAFNISILFVASLLPDIVCGYVNVFEIK